MLKGYWPHKNDISYHDGLLLKGCWLIIPQAVQAEMLDHSSSHLGISKCRERAYQVIFWVGFCKRT